MVCKFLDPLLRHDKLFLQSGILLLSHGKLLTQCADDLLPLRVLLPQ